MHVTYINHDDTKWSQKQKPQKTKKAFHLHPNTSTVKIDTYRTDPATND